MDVRLGALLVGVAVLVVACASVENPAPDSTSPIVTAAAAAQASAQLTGAASATVNAPTTPATSATAAVVLDPHESGQLRNFLDYEFPPAPQVPTGPLSPAAWTEATGVRIPAFRP